MIEGHWYFCGLDTFDVPPNDGKYYLHNAPFLDYEISGVLVDRILMPWRSQVLQNLSDLSYDNKKTNRFALLLANFVLQPTFGLLNTAAKSARNRFQEACKIVHSAATALDELTPIRCNIYIYITYQQHPCSFQNFTWTFPSPDQRRPLMGLRLDIARSQ